MRYNRAPMNRFILIFALLMMPLTMTAAKAEVKVITDSKALVEVVKSNPVVVVDFSSERCYLCKYLEPVYDKFSNEFEGKVVFVRMMIDHKWDESDRKLNRKFPFDGLPDLFVYRKSKLSHKCDRSKAYDSRLKYSLISKDNWYSEAMVDDIRQNLNEGFGK